MKTLIIVSHPQLAASPTQQFLKASAAGVKGATWHYLDAIKTLDVPAEQALIQAADRLIFEFPLYWYQAPASLHECWQLCGPVGLHTPKPAASSPAKR